MHSIAGMVTGSQMSAQNIVFLDKVHVQSKAWLRSTPTMVLAAQLVETVWNEWTFVLLRTVEFKSMMDLSSKSIMELFGVVIDQLVG